jgi:ketol-acid reductoisomerase
LASAPAVQRRTFVSALSAARAGIAAAPKAAVASPFVQTRGIKTIDFAGVKEDVYGMIELAIRLRTLLTNITERADWPRERLLVSHRLTAATCRLL